MNTVFARQLFLLLLTFTAVAESENELDARGSIVQFWRGRKYA